MEKLSFKLEIFEGPLDLLLHLIAKHKLDINDIEISQLIEQYLAYLDACMEHDLEIAGEFLEMAARLIYIKTIALLPALEEAEAEKRELQGALIEYSICKKAAAGLEKIFCGNDIFVRKQSNINIGKAYSGTNNPRQLLAALDHINLKKYKKKAVDTEPDKRFQVIVKHKMYSVTVKVVHILKQLYKTGSASMDSLYENITDRSERVATFLAVLELTKSGRIYINDDNTKISFAGKNKERAET